MNCVGILAESGKNKFAAVQTEGAARVARLAAEAGIPTMVHISAIGADAAAEAEYSRTKAAGEAAVLEYLPSAVILRPSIVFGDEDQFFNRFASMARMSPVVPLFGAKTRFQPVYVDDVAQAAVAGVLGRAAPGVYELGGPDVRSFRGLIQDMLAIISRRRLILAAPFWVGGIMGRVLDLVQAMTFGLVPNGVVTHDQIKNLQVDNVVSEGAKGLADLGIEPTDMASVLPEYLWPFRPSGQFDAIKSSAKNLMA